MITALLFSCLFICSKIEVTYEVGGRMLEYKPIRTKKIYEQVADSILDLLKKGQLKSGDKLDSVEVLAKNYNVEDQPYENPLILSALWGFLRCGKEKGRM